MCNEQSQHESTAEENRLRASQLESNQAGVYSSLANDLQKPLAKLILAEMGLEGLEQEGIQIEITTGLDALSRSNENDKINHWVSDLAGAQNLPEQVIARLKWSDFMNVTAAGRDIDPTKIVMTDAEADAAAQAQQQLQADMQSQVRAAGQAQQPSAPQQL